MVFIGQYFDQSGDWIRQQLVIDPGQQPLVGVADHRAPGYRDSLIKSKDRLLLNLITEFNPPSTLSRSLP